MSPELPSDMNMTKLKLTAQVLSLTALILTVQAPAALAGGYIYPMSKTSFVKPGQPVEQLHRLGFALSFDPEFSRATSFKINNLTILCTGDNVMKSAEIMLGGKVYGSGIFKRVPKYKDVYQAVIQPKDLIMQNNSYYAVDVDGITNTQTAALHVTVCNAKKMNLSASADGKTYAITSAFQIGGSDNRQDFAFYGNSLESVVLAGNPRRFNASSTSVGFDLQTDSSGHAGGAIKLIQPEQYQITVYDWDKNLDILGEITPNGGSRGAQFDILEPTKEQFASLDVYKRWDVQEIQMYGTCHENGSCGSLVLGNAK